LLLPEDTGKRAAQFYSKEQIEFLDDAEKSSIADFIDLLPVVVEFVRFLGTKHHCGLTS